MRKLYIIFFLLIAMLIGCSVPVENPEELTGAIEGLEQMAVLTPAPTLKPTPRTTPESTLEPTQAPTPEPTPMPMLESTPEPMPMPESAPEPMLEPTPEPILQPVLTESINNLSNKLLYWYFIGNKEHKPPSAQKEVDLLQYDAYYLGDTNEKVVYLTFDEGYENGFTPQILDILKEKGIQASFFMTKAYIKSNPDLAKRMVEEGHIAANHSSTHPSFPDLSYQQVREEILETEKFFQDVTGYEMHKFFRPPSGEYSERTLAIIQELGYKTVFWSFAYKDWLVDAQPPVSETFKTVMSNLHNGQIMLLHAVSKSNTEALPELIDAIHAEGYRFATIDSL